MMKRSSFTALILSTLLGLLSGCVSVSHLQTPETPTTIPPTPTQANVVRNLPTASPLPPEAYPYPVSPPFAEVYPGPVNPAATVPTPFQADPYPAPGEPTATPEPLPTIEPPEIAAEQEFADILQAEQAAGFPILAPGEALAGLSFWKAVTTRYADGVTQVTLYYTVSSDAAGQGDRLVLIAQAPYLGYIPTGFAPNWFGWYARDRLPVRGVEGEIYGPQDVPGDGQQTSLVWREDPLWLKVTLSGDRSQPGEGVSETLDERLVKIAECLVPAEMASWQVYTDPAGQFTVRLPETWAPGVEAGSFQGPDGFFRTAYLPELAFMDRVRRACERLANTPAGPVFNMDALPFKYRPYRHFDFCTLSPVSESSTAPIRLVVENPLGDPPHRYFYLEADAAHYQAINSSLRLLNPPADPYTSVRPTGPLRPEDEAFWRQPQTLPQDLTIEEYAVGESSADGRDTLGLDGELLEQARQKRAAWREKPGTWWIRRLSEYNELLKPFGYSLQSKDGSGASYTLYRGENLVLDQIANFRPVSVSESGSDFALVVEIQEGGRYRLVRRDSLSEWELFPLYAAPVFHGEELLSVRLNPEGSQIQVWLGDREIYAFAAANQVAPPVKGLRSWQGRWLAEIDGFLIQDCVNLNEQLGLEEIFGWRTLDGEPLYYFRKGPWMGISYAGQVLPVHYEDIIHYRCCEPAMYNNGGNEHMVWFYGLRDGVWYYVEIGKYGE